MFGATQPTSLRLSLGTGNAEMLGESTFDVTKPVPQSWRGSRGSSRSACGIAFFLTSLPSCLRCHPFVEILAQCLALCLYAGHVGANSSKNAIWNAQDESDAARGVQERPVALD